ncbi:hypothetical protein AR687_18645 [Flavobacteriaceae bacterium CRH]|nr:hypothetical protein AR687_18645 [Flavobacteriaceae bacterium CRH]
MKKLSILFVSVLTLGLGAVSCSSDDDDASIEGKWELTQAGLGAQGQESLENYSGDCSAPTYEFLAGGKLVDTENEYNDDSEKCEAFVSDAKWSKDGNNVTLTYTEGDDTEEIKYEVTELTNDKLKIRTVLSTEGSTTLYAIAVYARK